MKNIIYILALIGATLSAQKPVEIFIFNKAGADLLEGNYGRYSALKPVELPGDRYALPMRIMQDPDLRDAFFWVNLYKLDSTEIREMPKLGQRVEANIYYNYFDPASTVDDRKESGLVKCIMTHDRTLNEPSKEILRWKVKAVAVEL